MGIIILSFLKSELIHQTLDMVAMKLTKTIGYADFDLVEVMPVCHSNNIIKKCVLSKAFCLR
jgi:hypothetical protein